MMSDSYSVFQEKFFDLDVLIQEQDCVLITTAEKLAWLE